MNKYVNCHNGTVIRYWLTKKAPKVPGKERWVYGIGAEMTANDTDIRRNTVDNVFCVRKDAEAFINLIAENGIEPCHLEDVIFDYLTC